MNAQSTEEAVKQIRHVSRETFERLTIYHDLLVQWQRRINLISPTTIDKIWQRHILDSVQVRNVVPEAKSIIDIGSGAGFPGLVLAILLADEGGGSVELVESNGKKCAFMNAVIRDCGLRDSSVTVSVIHQRIEVYLPDCRPVDVVSARALASLKDLLRLTEDLLTQDTVGVFSKGTDHASEIKDALADWGFSYEKTDSAFQNGSVILKISQLHRR